MACGDAMTFQTDGGRESLVGREGAFFKPTMAVSLFKVMH
jgi:hypothetical protein